MTREEAKKEIIDMANALQLIPNTPKGMAVSMALKALERESCEDAVSRQAVIDAVRKNTSRLTFAEEQGCEGHVLWSAKAVPSDAIEGALLELPPVTAQPKMGHWEWVQYDYNPKLGNWHCSECRSIAVKCVDKNEKGGIPLYKYCPNCGAKMVEPQESEDKE